MQHHLRKAKEIHSNQGLREAAKSMIRYIPIEFNNLVFRALYGSGTHIMDEDWDNLIILDACRYDMFDSQITIEGTLESRISLGSSSEEFLEQNFRSRTCYDTVYVNANPYLPRLGLDQGTFHTVIDCLNGWDTELQTIRPETVAAEARRAYDEFPDKRFIVHFMQPHAPFIGEIGRSMVGGGWTRDNEDETELGIWNLLRENKTNVTLDTVWEAYTENLDVVLSEVNELIQVFDGKTVVTADHGNLVGERLSPIPTRQKYGHPYGVHTQSLVKVPWFIVENDKRRNIRSSPPINNQSISEEIIDERLKSLGYR